MNTRKQNMRKMAVCLLGGLLGVVASPGASVISEAVNYQGVLTYTMTGEVVTEEQNVTVRIYDLAQGGQLLWGETVRIYPKKTEPQKGLFSLVLGNGTPLSGTTYTSLRQVFALGDGQDARYIEFQLEGELSPIAPRQRFLPTPYVFTAADAAGVADSFQVDGKLIVSSSSLGTYTLTASRNLDVAEYLTLSGGVDIEHDAKVTGGATFNEQAHFSGPVVFSNAVGVNGNLTSGSYAEFNGGVGWSKMDAVSSANTSVSIGTTYKVPTDGFLIIEFKTFDKDNDWNGHVDVLVGSFTMQMRQFQNYDGAGDMRYYDVAMVPVAKDESYKVSVNGSLGTKDEAYSLSAEFIPLGK